MNRKIEEPEIIENESEQLLWSVGLKSTPGRIALIEFLQHQDKPASVAAIVQALAASTQSTGKNPSKKSVKNQVLNTASIYRALGPLVETGLVNRIDASTGHATYEMRYGRAHHHHLICESCGVMEDIEKCLPKNIESAVLADSSAFYAVYRHSLEFFGTCKKCAR